VTLADLINGQKNVRLQGKYLFLHAIIRLPHIRGLLPSYFSPDLV